MPEDWSRLKKGWTHLKKVDIPAPVPGKPIEMILGCVSLRLFESIRLPLTKGTGDHVAAIRVGGRRKDAYGSCASGRGSEPYSCRHDPNDQGTRIAGKG